MGSCDEKVHVDTKASSSNKLLMLLCAALLGLLIVACSVFTVLYVRNLHDQQMEWVGFKGSFEGRSGSMNEESEVDAGRRIIVHVNAEGWKLGINNSISLHDYNNGLLATRIMESGTCMIINLIDTYEEAVATIHRFNVTGVAVERPMRYFDGGVMIPQDQLDSEIGANLAGFCHGFPTKRLHEIPPGAAPSRQRRQTSGEFEAVCVRNVFKDVRLA